MSGSRTQAVERTLNYDLIAGWLGAGSAKDELASKLRETGVESGRQVCLTIENHHPRATAVTLEWQVRNLIDRITSLNVPGFSSQKGVFRSVSIGGRKWKAFGTVVFTCMSFAALIGGLHLYGADRPPSDPIRLA